MFKLAAFADEISPNLDDQIRVCRKAGVTHFELRGVDGRNVLDFDAALRTEIRSKLADNGMGVVCIGSPIGKVSIAEPFEPHFERFKIAVAAAEFFAAPFIRVFSYYPDADKKIIPHRDEVLRRMRAKVEYLRDRPITLLHENERDIYGEKVAQCVDLMKTIDSPKLRSAFDFANFVQVGEDPQLNWPLLKPWTVHIHVKDAVAGTARVVPAGQGDGGVGPILEDLHRSGYEGFLSLEPHLSAAGPFSGFSGEKLFLAAADALRALCARHGLPIVGA